MKKWRGCKRCSKGCEKGCRPGGGGGSSKTFVLPKVNFLFLSISCSQEKLLLSERIVGFWSSSVACRLIWNSIKTALLNSDCLPWKGLILSNFTGSTFYFNFSYNFFQGSCENCARVCKCDLLQWLRWWFVNGCVWSNVICIFCEDCDDFLVCCSTGELDSGGEITSLLCPTLKFFQNRATLNFLI